MRLISLDDDTAVDVERIVAMRQNHYTLPEPAIHTTVYLRNTDSYVTVKATIAEIAALIRTTPVDVTK